MLRVVVELRLLCLFVELLTHTLLTSLLAHISLHTREEPADTGHGVIWELYCITVYCHSIVAQSTVVVRRAGVPHVAARNESLFP